METQFKELLAAQSEIEKIETFSLDQRNHGNMGGLSTEILVGSSPVFVTHLIKYLNANQATIIATVKESLAKEVDAARLVAIKEAEEFISAQKLI